MLLADQRSRTRETAAGFADLHAARGWASQFIAWYNHEHRHSGFRFVSPAQRHAGHDREILARRHALYTQAREVNPRRWARHTLNWMPIATVTLNPERESVVDAVLRWETKSAEAA